jgi:hypothetical protein
MTRMALILPVAVGSRLATAPVTAAENQPLYASIHFRIGVLEGPDSK